MTEKPPMCERCNYNEVDPKAVVAEHYKDHFQAICDDCERELNRLQAKHHDWADS